MAATTVPDLSALFRLDGRVVILTGASSGLGERFARVLHAAGAKVTIAARRADRLAALADELPGTVASACDVGDDASCEALVASVLEREGHVDVLINNAGLNFVAPPEDEPMADFRRVMDVNCNGAFHLSQLVAKGSMLARGGSIVNVASVLGLVGSGSLTHASYSASKGALINLTRDLAGMWARKNVRVNALCPGWFETEMTQELMDDEKGRQWLRRNTPMGRIGRIDELDGALLFLCSDASTFVTGTTLVVDGGWTSR